MEQYEEHFIPESWCEASVHLPYKIYNNINVQENIQIVEKEYFYYPSYNETNKIFEDNEIIDDKLITLHFWNTYSNKYYKNIIDFDWMNTNDSLYSKLMKNVFSFVNSGK
jgi:hypothetical protein